MPVTLSTIPSKTKKPTKPTKKQDDAARTYKSNLNGPGPQPPSPESDVTTDNDEDAQTATNATNATNPTASSKKKSKKTDTLSQRLEVNKLLSKLYPSKHITEKVAALESLSNILGASAAPNSAAPKKKPRSRNESIKKNANGNAKTNSLEQQEQTQQAQQAQDQDPVANAIIATAFGATAFGEPSSAQLFVTPPSSPPSAPSAPKKATRTSSSSRKKQKQNFNIIIHVEPNPNDNANAVADISKRLDFGKKNIQNHNAVTEDDDDSDEDYVPSSDGGSWSTYDDEYDDDEYDEDDDESYYSSDSSSDDDSDDVSLEELDQLQQKHTEEMKMLQSLRATYENLLASDKTNRIVAKQLKTLKESEEKIKQELDQLMHTQKRKNSNKFRKLLRRKSSTNDLEYFKKHLTIQQQRAMIDEMNAVAKVTEIEKPYKLTLLESDIPRDMKAVAIRKIGMLQYMEPGCGEYCKLKTWVDAFMQIPFNRNKNLPITISDGVEQCHEFMTSAKTRLDTAVYGLNDAKMQIMQMVGQWIANPAAIGTAVAIHGPPGTGKTSLVKEGISKILGRDFAFIALGGATDSSCLEGHSYTYEGSVWGKIADILIRCKSSNPVIYFDELDKISETSKGEEIVGILTHLTDTSQNSQFHDKYFSEVAFDLSKCLFIFSYNDESRVNPVLLDRMYKIKTTGYNTKDKTFIAQNYLIPRIRSEVAFAEGDIIIPDAVVEHIVENHTNKEAGVRNLKRCLETVYTKLNLHRLMRPGTQLFDDKETSLEVSFPYTVSREVVDKLIKKNESDRPNMNLYL